MKKSAPIKLKPKRYCQQCGAAFVAYRPHQRFCSVPCQQAWNYAQRKELMAEAKLARAKGGTVP